MNENEQIDRPDLKLYLIYVKIYNSKTNKITNGLCRLYTDIIDLNFSDLHSNNGFQLKHIIKTLQSYNKVEYTNIIDVYGILDYTYITNTVQEDMSDVENVKVIIDNNLVYDSYESEYINERYL